MRRYKRYTPGVTTKGKIYFFVLKNVFCRLAYWLWVSKITGKPNIPLRAPFLIVANHQSYFDFMVLTFAFRKIRFLCGFIKDSYYDSLLFKPYLSHLDQIRVDRKRKNDSIAKAIEVLKGGHVVVIFPEGTRSEKGELGKFHKGLGCIAEALPDIQIVPFGIKGANKVWPRNLSKPLFFGGRRINLTVGKPLSFSDFEGNKEEFSAHIENKIRSYLV